MRTGSVKGETAVKRFWVGLFNGLCCLAVSVALGLALLLTCDWLFRADVRLLGIPQRSGLEEASILENYHAVTAYLAPWNEEPFALRGLAWSAAGAEYFRRLRIGVLCVYILGLLGGIGLICLHGARRRLGRKIWNISGTITLGLATVFGVFLALDFNWVMSGFCGTLFGESWLLYEDLDPIVTIFHPSFFLHAAFFILFCIVAGSLLQFVAGYTPVVQPARSTAPDRPVVQTGPRSDVHVRKAPPAAPEKQVFRLQEQSDKQQPRH